MSGMICRLLDGCFRKCRRENVLTVEVFQTLDFLPRTDFLGSVLRAAHGAKDVRDRLIADIENTTIEMLVGDIRPL